MTKSITPLAERKVGWRCEKGFNPENKTGIHPQGHRVLLVCDPVEKKTESGIVLPEAVTNKEKIHMVQATVLEIGCDCWSDKSTDACQVGDRVLVGKFAGKFEQSLGSDEECRIVADLDIYAVIAPKA